jgi:NAD(P)-dependent dehydrogenase (short-subunit alcohol dehydrogenase family)
VTLDDFGLDAFSIEGRCAVVTGGTTGLGQAMTVALARAGADVLVAGLTPDDGSTQRRVEEAGRRWVALETDVTAPGEPARIVEECRAAFGSVDILVNSAGTCLIADVEDFGREQWDPMVAVNLTATFELSRAAAAVMREQGHGKIVNVASLFSFLGGTGSPAYAATKAGIAGFTRAYCDELARYNIQVNAIAPGYMATALTAAAQADEETSRRIVAHIPADRWGEPADLMGAVVFLASRASDYVNGHLLVVDGGYLVR